MTNQYDAALEALNRISLMVLEDICLENDIPVPSETLNPEWKQCFETIRQALEAAQKNVGSQK